MKPFYAKLHPPRANFAQTMSAAEVLLMQQHGAYLREFSGKGWLVAFGPVADPQGFFGIAIWELPDGEDAAALCANDPLIKSNQGFRYEIHPMPSIVTRK
ncbi:MAG TPA: YciI family protein [Candidatus Didemnitutus sp.]|nr:YciI family protein [Candidatus Didemnitutus sp.]